MIFYLMIIAYILFWTFRLIVTTRSMHLAESYNSYDKKMKIRRQLGIVILVLTLCHLLYVNLQVKQDSVFAVAELFVLFSFFSAFVKEGSGKYNKIAVISFIIFGVINAVQFGITEYPEYSHEMKKNSIHEKNVKIQNKESGIAWDYENPEIFITKYSIMGVSNNEIVIKIMEDGKEVLRAIPKEKIARDSVDDVLLPYLYRKNYVYTEYNYDVEPKEVLRKDNEMWSGYFLCASEEKLNELLKINKQGVHWDYNNPKVVEKIYPVLSVSSENFVIKVAWNDEISERIVPLNEVRLEFSEDVEVPYLKRYNYIYTEYDYDVEPPKALREDSETWTEYVFYGSEKQLQSLLGYEMTLNIEQ